MNQTIKVLLVEAAAKRAEEEAAEREAEAKQVIIIFVSSRQLIRGCVITES